MIQPVQTVASIPGGPTPHAGSSDAPLTQCWRLQGVYGDGSCADLSTFAHCRNCPVHAEAARRYLDRPIPPGRRQEWAKSYARPGKDPKLSGSSVLIFRLRSNWFGWPLQWLQETTERRPVHSLMGKHRSVLGIANVRGELLMCLSLGHLLGLANPGTRAELLGTCSRLVVVHCGQLRFCFPVEEVTQTRRITAQEAKLALDHHSPSGARHSPLRLLRAHDGQFAIVNPELLCARLEAVLK